MLRSLPVIASYVFDWLLLVAIAIVGYVLNNLAPNHHAFSLTDTAISYPLGDDTVSIGVAGVIAVVAPVVIILLITFIFVPGPTVPPNTPASLKWKRRLWELHASLLGLAASVDAAWFITNGLKQLFGKPRPNMLARCQPDLSDMAAHVVGGFLTPTNDGRLVSNTICTNPDKAILEDGFRSFPSGHTSITAAGLVYLTLVLASKLGAAIPFLHPREFAGDERHTTAFPSRLKYQTIASPIELDTRAGSDSAQTNQGESPSQSQVIAARSQAAAPPLYLIILMLLPVGTAVFVGASRWYDYMHNGFDVLVSFAMGTLYAYVGFRFYHLPIGRGAGWAWAPRSRTRAFWAGIGNTSYAVDTSDRSHHDSVV